MHSCTIKPHLLTTLITFFTLTIIITPTKSTMITKPGCEPKCGNLTIPYPFGLSLDCSAEPTYHLTCNHSKNTPPSTFLSTPTGPLQVVKITNTQLSVTNQLAYSCQNSSNNSITLSLTKRYSVSYVSNYFKVVGCYFFGTMYSTVGMLVGITGCPTTSSPVKPGSCYGAGCVQYSLMPGVSNVNITIVPLNSVVNVSVGDPVGPCGYAYFDGSGRVGFRGLEDLEDPGYLDRVVRDTPMVLDWVIGESNCSGARQDKVNDFVCKENARCVDGNGQGYNCQCVSGYHGNPYLGCTDYDECANPKSNDCVKPSVCVNTPGSYYCVCPSGFTGNGKKGVGCIPSRSRNLALKLSLGISIGIVALLLILNWIYFTLRRRRLSKMREIFFEQNGGLLLQQLLMRKQDGMETTKIYTSEELKEATNNFSEDTILGRGGHGAVYKGTLPNNKVVAIKKSKVIDANEIEQFINEIVILMQINHRHVVKLLGCCMETKVPLLVYEYIPKGTLYDLIHGGSCTISWIKCLQIAMNVAGALSYLHSSASIPIIHRDVKSKNILLDENDTPKMADFGASRLIPLDQTQVTTLVQGTLGYLDPEYFYSSQLNAKSDVYSFGVVLTEILTKQKPLSSSRSIEARNLATYFVTSMKEEAIFKIIDANLVREAPYDDLICVANLTMRCLSIKGEDRPMMKEVALELEKCWNHSNNYSNERGNMNLNTCNDECSGSNEHNSLDSVITDITLPR